MVFEFGGEGGEGREEGGRREGGEEGVEWGWTLGGGGGWRFEGIRGWSGIRVRE